MAAHLSVGRSSDSRESRPLLYPRVLRLKSGIASVTSTEVRAWLVPSKRICPWASTSLRVRLTKRCYSVSHRLSRPQRGIENHRLTFDRRAKRVRRELLNIWRCAPHPLRSGPLPDEP